MNPFIKSIPFLVCLSCCLMHPVGAQDTSFGEIEVAQREYPTETLFNLWLGYLEDNESLSRFYDSLPEKHIVEVDEDRPGTAIVTYFAKGGENTEYLLQSGGPDFYGLRFRQFGKSPYYFCTQEIPSDAWFSYGVNEFTRTFLPGANGLAETSMEHIYDGTVVGPDAPLSVHVQVSQSIPKGILREVALASAFMDEERSLIVYTPAGYDSSEPHHLVVQLDGQRYASGPAHGQDWQGWTPMPTILDNLISGGEIAPIVAVLVPNQGQRAQDLLSDAFADFLALEVIPWARANFNISDSSAIVVSGPSRAAFAAANAALAHPDVIDGVLSQSGSFYYTLDEEENWPVYPKFEGRLLTDLKGSPKRSVKFYLDVGLYDLGLGRVGVNRQLKDILEFKGYRFCYNEYNGGHSHLNWRHTLSNGLVYFFGGRVVANGCE